MAEAIHRVQDEVEAILNKHRTPGSLNTLVIAYESVSFTDDGRQMFSNGHILGIGSPAAQRGVVAHAHDMLADHMMGEDE